MANICLLGRLLSWLYFYINSCCCIKSMQVFKDIFPICSCFIILYQWDALYIPSIELSPLQLSVLLVQVFQTHNIYLHFVDCVDILWLVHQFIDMNFVLSATINLFLGLIFLLLIWLIFSKVSSSWFVGYTMVETFIIDSHPAVAKKRSVISFSPPFSLSSFSFLVLVLTAKHHSHILTKLVSLTNYWYPISDTIVVICKVKKWLAS